MRLLKSPRFHVVICPFIHNRIYQYVHRLYQTSALLGKKHFSCSSVTCAKLLQWYPTFWEINYTSILKTHTHIHTHTQRHSLHGLALYLSSFSYLCHPHHPKLSLLLPSSLFKNLEVKNGWIYVYRQLIHFAV